MRALCICHGKKGDMLSAEEIFAANEEANRNGQVVFGIGSVLRGDDAAGPRLVKKMEDAPVEGWVAVDGGQTPENDLGYLRRLTPRRLLLVDAAAMGLEPGAIRRLRAADVATQSFITTHTLPITYLLGELESICKEVIFLGIQPSGTEFFDPVHTRVLAAVDVIYQYIAKGDNFEEIPYFNDERN